MGNLAGGGRPIRLDPPRRPIDTGLHKMGKYRLDSIASLARQMAFASAEVRLSQLSAAEALLLELDPLKAYPYDYVVFRVTGYRPKDPGKDLLTGLALQHDLGLLVEQVSETLSTPTADFPEPVLQIEDLTARFNVTSKTIQRWRRRGLPARRFVFPDGRRRVGFVLSVVERFLATHEDQVHRGTNFTQVSEAERDEIVRRARRLAVVCQCCENEIARRIAKHTNRSPLTIKYTIKRHDEENPQDAIFRLAPEGIGEGERGRILKAFRRGLPIDRLARRACRPRSAVYRVIVEERIARLNKRKVRFIDDPLYHQPDAERLLTEMVEQAELPAAAAREETRVPRDLPPYLQELYRTPLLTPGRERALFLKFNFHKQQFVAMRRRLEPQFARARELNQLEGHLRRATETKNAIVRANLRLVVSVARKHLRPGLNLMELISDGNITLMRAVESFDAHRGFRFSTYASLALMKGFARSIPLMRAAVAGTTGGEAASRIVEVPDARGDAVTRQLVARDELQRLLAGLNAREREIVQSHFGVDRAAPASYDELSVRLGLTKARVRQIEQAAMAKLRDAASAAAATAPAR